MKNLRRFLSCLLAVTMLLALGVTAYAGISIEDITGNLSRNPKAVLQFLSIKNAERNICVSNIHNQ